MADEFEVTKTKIKENITILINQNNLKRAQTLLDQYINMVKEDPEAFSLQAVININQGNLDEAETIIKRGLLLDNSYFDLLYNLAYILEVEQKYAEAAQIYSQLCLGQYSEEQRISSNEALQRIRPYTITDVIEKEKIVFFVKTGMDSFIGEIIKELSCEYETKKVIVTDLREIDTEMQWADICWFEWCDELIIHASHLKIACKKKLICRLHSYEAFSDYTAKVNWDNVDQVIFVAKHIKDFALESTPALSKDKAIVIPNGIDVEQYSFRERKPGFNIAYVGYINYKKGPMLLLHAFKAIYDKDHRYKLYIAGVFQDHRDVLYFKQMTHKLGIDANVFYEGWQDNINQWLDNKDYILCTSILESQGMGIMQAMSKGIKPLIHNFVGAEYIYSEKYIWTTIDDCVAAARNKVYTSSEYRKFVEDNYAFKVQMAKINQLLNNHLENNATDKGCAPLVTIGILSYNYGHFLDHCMSSILSQSYKNIEILVSDDCSTDGSVEQWKEYEAKYSNVRVIYHEKNSGYAIQGLSDIVREARGKYFMYLSLDDYFSRITSLEEAVQIGECYPDVDFIYSDLKLVDKDGIYMGMWTYQQYTADEIVHQTFNRFGSGVIPLAVGGLFKTEFYRKNNRQWCDDNAGNNAGDTLHTIINLTYNWKVKYLNKDIVSYRQHTDNLSFNLKKRVPSIINLIEYIINNFSEEVYLSQINWKEYSGKSKDGFKNFVIGKYYYEMLCAYEEQYSANLTKSEKRELLQLIVAKIKAYFNRSMYFTNDFMSRISEIKEKLEIMGYPMVTRGLTVAKGFSQKELVVEGLKLKDALLAQYKDKYSIRKLKILIFSPDNGAWKYTFQAWKTVMEYMGIQVTLIDKVDHAINYEENEIFITLANKYFIDKYSMNQSINKIPKKIGVATKENFFDSTNSENDLQALQVIAHDSSFQFLISSFVEGHIKNIFAQWVNQGVKIYSIPFGFNPLIHYPENTKQEIDYFFVGHNSYIKAEETCKYLEPIFSKYQRGLLGGTGWGRHVHEILPQDVRYYYSKAKINLNYHIEIQKRYECEVNERTYIICACGGFQLVDNPKYLQCIYTPKDIAIAQDAKQYLELFEYYLHKPNERIEMAYNGLAKTYENDSSLFQRMDNLLKLL